MKASKTKNGTRATEGTDDPDVRSIIVRLDAIILLLATPNFSDAAGKLRIGQVAKILHRAGFTPTEIAKFFGKQKATDISKYLY